MLRDFKAANETVDRARAISPNSFGLWEIKSKLAILERGDLSVAQNALEELEKSSDILLKKLYVEPGRSQLLLEQRRYAEALQAAEKISDVMPEGKPDFLIGKQMLIGCARKGLGDENGARIAFAKAKESSQARLKTLPGDAGQHAQLAVALAFLGERESALAEAKRAMDLLPESKDAFEGPGITEVAAQVSCIVGDHAHALELLDGLLSRPAQITVEVLKLDPIWDPLRKDPAFQSLIEKYSVKT
jgi:serine/threonine-protein kinase